MRAWAAPPAQAAWVRQQAVWEVWAAEGPRAGCGRGGRGGRMPRGPSLRLPILTLVRAEDVVPERHQDSEVVAPHLMMVMDVMHWLPQPKAHLGTLVLELVGVRREYRVQGQPGRPSHTGRHGNQKPNPDERDGGQEVIAEFAEPTLTDAFAMVF